MLMSFFGVAETNGLLRNETTIKSLLVEKSSPSFSLLLLSHGFVCPL